MISGQPDTPLYADLEQLIPQRVPMVMIDGLDAVSDDGARSRFAVADGNIFVNNGCFGEAGLLEHMAQTAAARAGCMAAAKGEAPPVGFIGGVKDLRIHRLPKVGDELKTTITVLHEVLNASVVKGEVYLNDDIIASCELKIFINP